MSDFCTVQLKNWAIHSSAEFRKSVGTSTPLQHVLGTTRHLPLYGDCTKDVRAKDTTKVEDSRGQALTPEACSCEPVLFDMEGFVKQGEEWGEEEGSTQAAAAGQAADVLEIND